MGKRQRMSKLLRFIGRNNEGGLEYGNMFLILSCCINL